MGDECCISSSSAVISLWCLIQIVSSSLLQSLDWTHGVLNGVGMDLVFFMCQTTLELFTIFLSFSFHAWRRDMLREYE